MAIESHDGYLIHLRKQGESSADLLCFTEHRGLIRCRYRAALSSKKRAALLPFSLLHLELQQRGDFAYLNQAELQQRPANYAGRILFSALYMNELLYLGLKPEESCVSLYQQYQKSLQQLSLGPGPLELQACLRRFEWVLLMTLGLALELSVDIHGRAIADAGQYQLIPAEGFVPVTEGISGRHLLAFSENKLDDQEILRSAKHFMRQALDFALDGREIKSRALFAKSTKRP